MIVWLCAAAMAGPIVEEAPSSMRGSASYGLFRDGLDRLNQPATLAWQPTTDLWTQLALRSRYGGLDLGTVTRMPGGSFGANVSWGRSSARTVTGDVEDELIPELASRRDDFRVDLSVARALSNDWSVGVGAWGRARIAASSSSWNVQGADTALPVRGADVRLATTDAQAGLRLWFAHRSGERSLDVHARVVWAEKLTRVHASGEGVVMDGFVDDAILAGGAPFATSNRRTWAAAVTVDRTGATRRRVALRTLVDAQIASGGLAQPRFDQVVDGDGSIHAAWSEVGDLGGALDLSLLGRAGWTDLELWFGGEVDVRAADFHGVRDVTVQDIQAGGGRATSDAMERIDAVVRIGVPLAIEAVVHPKVVFRASAEVGWRMAFAAYKTSTVADFKAKDWTRSLNDDLSYSGHTGIRWTPLSRLAWDLTTGVGSSGSSLGTGRGGAGGLGGASYEVDIPEPTQLDVGTISLSVGTSLILRL